MINKLEEKVENYIKSLTPTNEEIAWNFNMKIEHTARVQKNIIDLCNSLNLSIEQTNLARMIAILHDIGRYEQYLHFGTFKDNESVDHASLGLDVIKRENFLGNYESKDLIYTAINFHNKKDLPSTISEDELLFCKLIRDADKLDIYALITNYYEQEKTSKKRSLELSLPDTSEISSAVYNSLMEKKIVDLDDVKNLNDFKLLQIGWIYDINFEFTRKKIIEGKYLDRIFDKINCDYDLSELKQRTINLA